MKTLIGILVGMILMANVSYRYGPQWSAQLRQLANQVQAREAGEHTGEVFPGVLAAAAAMPAPPAPPEPIVLAPPTPSQEPPGRIAAQWQGIMDAADELQADGDFPWQDCFRRAAATYQLPEALLLAVARGESNFDPAARSHRDAIGLMQIQWPQTAHHLGVRLERQLYDPCLNVDAGGRYLRELIDRYDGDVHLALAAYNYGPSRVSPGEIPDLASEYSAYIFGHLQAVVGKPFVADPAPSSVEVVQEAGRLLLLRFGHAHRADAFLAYLRDTAPQLQFSVAKEARGDHAVYLSYKSDSDRQRALDSLLSSGLLPMLAANHSNPQ